MQLQIGASALWNVEVSTSPLVHERPCGPGREIVRRLLRFKMEVNAYAMVVPAMAVQNAFTHFRIRGELNGPDAKVEHKLLDRNFRLLCNGLKKFRQFCIFRGDFCLELPNSSAYLFNFNFDKHRTTS